MTARQAGILVLPGVLVLGVAIPFGMAHLVAAAVSVGLTVPAAFGTFWLARWMATHHPLGGVVGMLAGTMARLVVAFGGGAAVFLLTDVVRDTRLGFWLWLLFAYLATLLAETALLVRLNRLAVAEASGGKG